MQSKNWLLSRMRAKECDKFPPKSFHRRQSFSKDPILIKRASVFVRFRGYLAIFSDVSLFPCFTKYGELLDLFTFYHVVTAADQQKKNEARQALHILASVANWAAVKLKCINLKLCNFRIWTLRRHKGDRTVLLQRRPHSQMRSLQGLVKLEIKLGRTARVADLPPIFSALSMQFLGTILWLWLQCFQIEVIKQNQMIIQDCRANREDLGGQVLPWQGALPRRVRQPEAWWSPGQCL